MNQTEDDDWPKNYFNYFTEIEEHFQRARGTVLFMLSPLDWALIENWKNAGIPLEAVLKGIDAAFEKWRSRKIKRRLVNSLAYCAQAVLEAAQRTSSRATVAASDAPFADEELRAYLNKAAAAYLAYPAASEVGNSLKAIADDLAEQSKNLEDLERRLTTLEEKAVAIIRSVQTDDDLYSIRAALDQELKPYRGKMSADQISMLERRYLDTALLNRAKLPRLSLFYLH
jgi:predicted ribosome quality control (RQC) complex YloA/Tae2 family protein